MEETDLNEKLCKGIMSQLSNLSIQSNGWILSIRSYQRFCGWFFVSISLVVVAFSVGFSCYCCNFGLVCFVLNNYIYPGL